MNYEPRWLNDYFLWLQRRAGTWIHEFVFIHIHIYEHTTLLKFYFSFTKMSCYMPYLVPPRPPTLNTGLMLKSRWLVMAIKTLCPYLITYACSGTEYYQWPGIFFSSVQFVQSRGIEGTVNNNDAFILVRRAKVDQLYWCKSHYEFSFCGSTFSVNKLLKWKKNTFR